MNLPVRVKDNIAPARSWKYQLLMRVSLFSENQLVTQIASAGSIQTDSFLQTEANGVFEGAGRQIDDGDRGAFARGRGG